jgi:hypothetical protein
VRPSERKPGSGTAAGRSAKSSSILPTRETASSSETGTILTRAEEDAIIDEVDAFRRIGENVSHEQMVKYWEARSLRLKRKFASAPINSVPDSFPTATPGPWTLLSSSYNSLEDQISVVFRGTSEGFNNRKFYILGKPLKALLLYIDSDDDPLHDDSTFTIQSHKWDDPVVMRLEEMGDRIAPDEVVPMELGTFKGPTMPTKRMIVGWFKKEQSYSGISWVFKSAAGKKEGATDSM